MEGLVRIAKLTICGWWLSGGEHFACLENCAWRPIHESVKNNGRCNGAATDTPAIVTNETAARVHTLVIRSPILPEDAHDYDDDDCKCGQNCSTNQDADEKADPPSLYFHDGIYDRLPIDENPKGLATKPNPV